jgi:hypothetical protein
MGPARPRRSSSAEEHRAAASRPGGRGRSVEFGVRARECFDGGVMSGAGLGGGGRKCFREGERERGTGDGGRSLDHQRAKRKGKTQGRGTIPHAPLAGRVRKGST